MHLSLGNPHSVVGVDEVAVVDLLDLGGKVPHVNLEIVEPGPETTGITMRVHERGAGITEACGTGACAAAFAARSWGLVAGGSPEVIVHMDGGTAIVGFDDAEPGRVSLTGPATYVGTVRSTSTSGSGLDPDRPTRIGAAMTTPYNEAFAATLIDRTIRERIVLVAVAGPSDDDETVEASLDELALLIDTAGADEVGRMVQRRDSPDHTWYIGKGKAEELHQLCLAVDADTVVFDNELKPRQQFNLEKLLGRTALDRTAVILDIFGQNAHTLEGKAQVELALLRYRLPRLRRGSEAKLSQQRGGVGARFGGGETKIETDRRRIMRRIEKLERDLDDLADTRSLQRKGRGQSGLASVAIVGYTNAGKSTLLNQLTNSGVLVENRLFATLDPTTRRLALPGGEPVLLSDTVGFINRLPHGLVESFKGTLEVAALADYLVHVVDASAPDPQAQIDAVRVVLDEIDAAAVPELLVFNKADLAPGVAKELVEDHPGSVAISASTGEHVDEFLRTLSDRLRLLTVVREFVIPYDRGDVLAAVHREGEVVSIGEGEESWTVRARLSDASAGRLESVLAASEPEPTP